MPRKIIKLNDLLALKADKVIGPLIKRHVCATDRYIADYLGVPCYKYQSVNLEYRGDNLIALWANLPNMALDDSDVISYPTISLPRVRSASIHSISFSPLGRKLYTGPSISYVDIEHENLGSILFTAPYVNLLSLKMMSQRMVLQVPHEWPASAVFHELDAYLELCDMEVK